MPGFATTYSFVEEYDEDSEDDPNGGPTWLDELPDERPVERNSAVVPSPHPGQNGAVVIRIVPHHVEGEV